MAREDWVVGGTRREAAADRIYHAATELVVARGLDAFDIDTLAARLHCSRATIYRYAGGKTQIRDAVLTRLAARVVDTVRQAVDGLSGSERVITAIKVALDQIRADPIRRLTLSPGTATQLGDLHSSTVLRRIAADLTGITDDDPEAAQWIVRVVVSFAYWPTADEAVEERLLRRFIAPAFAG
ncbi:TetR/AcrR family transcriptional regulator [Mycobacterium sp. E740]|uniref:TetR/AcrR family transcriptional regulator n=1 Tax=Mycobacterium sp. E740 TaxID=1834149 RepID=UPI0007FFAA46|nr:TetR family transcriptional regulator [Mycobacterium sp. E740]OBI76222.1 transcriptional regulator [Mycobacterium sp. E740]